MHVAPLPHHEVNLRVHVDHVEKLLAPGQDVFGLIMGLLIIFARLLELHHGMLVAFRDVQEHLVL